MRLTIIHPAIGHRKNGHYLRSWQMEPLPAAAIAGLTPGDVDVRFYDDRMEPVRYDDHVDAVAISLETYTAKRAYQIASEFRKRKVPVIFGGFHATLMPEEAERFAEAIVIGEAEYVWDEVVDDLRHGTLKKRYQVPASPVLDRIKIDRSIFRGKNYLPVSLLETGRGCRFSCEFCAIQTFFDRTRRSRPVEHILEELHGLKDRSRLFFFVDDNFAGDIPSSKILLKELAKINIRWVTQLSLDAAHDEEFLSLLAQAGCKGVLIGFESLDTENLYTMNKNFQTVDGGYDAAIENLRRHNICIYATFLFGYDHDTPESFARTLAFAAEQRFYIAAFNHLTPFPGTSLYKRLQLEGRLCFDAWWLDDRYCYNDVPFFPKNMTSEEVKSLCLEIRRKFYSWRGIVNRGFDRVNRCDAFMFANFFMINAMHRLDGKNRNCYPLGDENWDGNLLEAAD
jgi:radical SAM superfamily enzyme YgiQ (UPF0313 family)